MSSSRKINWVNLARGIPALDIDQLQKGFRATLYEFMKPPRNSSGNIIEWFRASLGTSWESAVREPMAAPLMTDEIVIHDADLASVAKFKNDFYCNLIKARSGDREALVWLQDLARTKMRS